MKHALIFAIAVAAFASLATLVEAASEGDPAEGKKAFKKCKVCHMIGEGAKRRIGPPLNDIIGAKAGAQEGVIYSKSMLEKGKERTELDRREPKRLA